MSAVNTVGLFEFQQAVRELCHKYPNAVYVPATTGDNCEYNTGDVIDKVTGKHIGTGCLMGQALQKLGFMEIPEGNLLATLTECGVIPEFPTKDMHELVQKLQDVQTYQDAATVWGEAYKAVFGE